MTLTDLPPSLGWFVGLTGLALLALALGHTLGRGPKWWGRAGLVVGVGIIAAWAFLARRPSVAVAVLPVGVLSRIEGVAAVPAFMLVCGVAWGAARLRHQRRLAMWAAALGAVYFLNGGLWMLQHTPGADHFDRQARREVLQTQDFSCVPAACATALTRLGLPTDEATMAELTETRAGTGSTLFRAMEGLSHRLEASDLRVVLVEPRYEQLSRMPMPALTPLQFEASRRHMVTLLECGPHGVLLIDPMRGEIWMPAADFLEAYRGVVLAFVDHRGIDVPRRDPWLAEAGRRALERAGVAATRFVAR